METHLSNFDLARSMLVGMVTAKIKRRQFPTMTRENLGHNKRTGERTERCGKDTFRITWIDRKLKVQNTFQQQWKLRGQVIWQSNPGLTIVLGAPCLRRRSGNIVYTLNSDALIQSQLDEWNITRFDAIRQTFTPRWTRRKTLCAGGGCHVGRQLAIPNKRPFPSYSPRMKYHTHEILVIALDLIHVNPGLIKPWAVFHWEGTI